MTGQRLNRVFFHRTGLPAHAGAGRGRSSLLLVMYVVMALACFVSARAAETTLRNCPDLSGTYVADQTDWIDTFHLHATGTVRPRGQMPQLATFRPREGGYTLIWHMPRNDLLAAAKRLAERDPRQYGLWLDMAMRDIRAPLPAGTSEQSWFNRVAFYGPVFRVDVMLPLVDPVKQCESGWFLVGTHGFAGPPKVESGMDGDRDAQLWLKRRNDGSLALRWRERRKVVVIREGRYSNESSIPLWSSSQLQTWKAAATPDLTPLREDELTARDRPPKCRVMTEQENQFFERLDSILPARAVQTNRARGSLYVGRMRPDGSCEPMPYFVTISAFSAADIATVEAFLKTEPLFAHMESLETETLKDGRVIARFKMVVP